MKETFPNSSICTESGLVTGGQHGSESGCQPYSFRHCEHHTTGPYVPCTAEGPTPKCSRKCREGIDNFRVPSALYSIHCTRYT